MPCMGSSFVMQPGLSKRIGTRKRNTAMTAMIGMCAPATGKSEINPKFDERPALLEKQVLSSLGMSYGGKLSRQCL